MELLQILINKYKKYNHQQGQSLVELLVAIGLSTFLIPALVINLYVSNKSKAQVSQRGQGVTYLKEMNEAVRSVRENGWSAFAINGTYHPVVNGTTWSLVSGSDTTNGFTRSTVISDVQRDSQGNIVNSGGTVDPSTKQIVNTVSWSLPYFSSISSTMYLTRYNNNLTTIQTTQADFNAGTLNGTTVTNTSGGEVVLGAGNANWCKPQNSIVNTLTLPKPGNAILAATGAAFIGTGDGTSGPVFLNVAINTPPPPGTPSAAIIATYSATLTTNAIYSDGSYAYLATSNTTNQVIILDIRNKPYTQIGTLNIPSGVGANGIYVSNNIAYVTSSNKLYTYDVTTKSGQNNSPLTSIAMWIGVGNTPQAKQVVVTNDHAYVGTSNTLFGLQTFAVSNNGSSLRLVGVSNLTWQQSAQGLTVNSTGTRAYVAFNNGAGFFSQGFFIVDISPADPPWWWPFPNFYTIINNNGNGTTTNGMDPRGMAITTDNKALVVGLGGSYQYQVIDISNESNPTFCGGLAITNGVTGVAGVKDQYNNVYSYIITGESQNQFKIIQGGNGGNYATTGTFESSTFAPGYSAGFNQFVATINQPSQTSIQMQVAVAAPFNGTCTNASFTYIGPDGTSSSYFTPSGNTISGIIPTGTHNTTYQNPNWCYRYKAWLTTTDTNQTPTLYDVTTNYSP